MIKHYIYLKSNGLNLNEFELAYPIDRSTKLLVTLLVRIGGF